MKDAKQNKRLPPVSHRIRDALHIVFPLLGVIRYRFPSRHLTIIGVTGTDGKSSTVLMLARILQTAGHRTAFFSSVCFSDGITEQTNDIKMTTPGHMFLQRFLRDAHRNGCSHIVLEITSEGIKQHRHRLIAFDTIVVTNITPEHIESHGNFDRYVQHKESLVRTLNTGNRTHKHLIINHDDTGSRNAVRVADPAIPTTTVSWHEPATHIRGTIEEADTVQTIFSFTTPTECTRVTLRHSGPFAAKNALMAAATAHALTVPLSHIRSGLENMPPIPGRYEVLSHKPLIIVDYAHTIAALKTLLPYVRKHTHGKLIHVFGAAGGGRDHWKRPELAKLSERYADVSIITEENPFDEDPELIARDIIQGFSQNHTVETILPREKAVHHALSLATPDDTVLCTAKGSETVIAGPQRSKRPYNERTFIKLCLRVKS